MLTNAMLQLCTDVCAYGDNNTEFCALTNMHLLASTKLDPLNDFIEVLYL